MNDPKEPTGEEGGDRFIPTEQRQGADRERLALEDRREEESDFEGEEKRVAPDRMEVFDRRAMGLEVPCKTSGSIDTIEDWLDENCDNDWQVVLKKVDINLSIKHLLIMF
jgi:hypothetical protein